MLCFLLENYTIWYSILFNVSFCSFCYIFHVSIEAPSRQVCILIPTSGVPVRNMAKANQKTMKLTQHIVQAALICLLVSKAINNCGSPKSTWKSDMMCVCVSGPTVHSHFHAAGNTVSVGWFIADWKLLNELWLLSITERWGNLKRAWLISRVI